jgi:hypothetical protein
LFQVMLVEVRQDIEVDVVRLERICVLSEIVLVQPVAKIVHVAMRRSSNGARKHVENTTFPAARVSVVGLSIETQRSGSGHFRPNAAMAFESALTLDFGHIAASHQMTR